MVLFSKRPKIRKYVLFFFFLSTYYTYFTCHGNILCVVWKQFCNILSFPQTKPIKNPKKATRLSFFCSKTTHLLPFLAIRYAKKRHFKLKNGVFLMIHTLFVFAIRVLKNGKLLENFKISAHWKVVFLNVSTRCFSPLLQNIPPHANLHKSTFSKLFLYKKHFFRKTPFQMSFLVLLYVYKFLLGGKICKKSNNFG